jgi:hypothetical protein
MRMVEVSFGVQAGGVGLRPAFMVGIFAGRQNAPSTNESCQIHSLYVIGKEEHVRLIPILSILIKKTELGHATTRIQVKPLTTIT